MAEKGRYATRCVKALCKPFAGPGLSLEERPEPPLVPGSVRIRVLAGSVCGTDRHIADWDAWAAGRMKPPVIIGHEFAGDVVEVASDVMSHRVGERVASESHLVCGVCRQCREGQAHVCVNTRILGVDLDGGFADFAVVPAANARHTSREVPVEIAAMQDALGNAVHTLQAGPVNGQRLLITGMGPIGLMAVAAAKAMGAAQVVATEVGSFRSALARDLGADLVIDPLDSNSAPVLAEAAKDGFDGALEMSGNPAALAQAIQHTRPGGRVSLLGVYADSPLPVDLNSAIFKGLRIDAVVGRRLWSTWDQMRELLERGALDVGKVITHRIAVENYQEAWELLAGGQAGKVVLTF
jgi:threonine 3-dehydrogenase